MEQIIQNFLNPEWWFTGIFFTFVAGVLPYLLKLARAVLRGAARSLQYRDLIWVRGIRRHEVLVIQQIVRTYALMVAFIVVAVVIIYVFAASPLAALIRTGSGKFFLLAVSSPIYLIEIAYLYQRDRLKLLLERHRRLLG